MAPARHFGKYLAPVRAARAGQVQPTTRLEADRAGAGVPVATVALMTLRLGVKHQDSDREMNGVL